MPKRRMRGNGSPIQPRSCRASRSCTPGSRRRTKAGGASRWSRWACRTTTSRRRTWRAMPNLRAQYDVILFPPLGGTRATPQDIVNGYAARPAAALEEDRRSLPTSASMRPTTCVPASGSTGVQRLLTFRRGRRPARHRARYLGVGDRVRTGALGARRRHDEAESARHDRAGHGHRQEASHRARLRRHAAALLLRLAGLPRRLPRRPHAARIASQRPRQAKTIPTCRRAGRSSPRRSVRSPSRAKRASSCRKTRRGASKRTCRGVEERPRVVVSFAEKGPAPAPGMLEGGDEIAGKPAVIDVPRGKGHIILMSHQSDVAHEHVGTVRTGDERGDGDGTRCR